VRKVNHWILKNSVKGYVGDFTSVMNNIYTKDINSSLVFASRDSARYVSCPGDVPVKVTVKITEIK
jgi:hypothetical protein